MPQHMTYGEALIAALDEVMEHDQRVVLFNPGFIGMATGQDKLTALRQKYAKRISSRPSPSSVSAASPLAPRWPACGRWSTSAPPRFPTKRFRRSSTKRRLPMQIPAGKPPCRWCFM